MGGVFTARGFGWLIGGVLAGIMEISFFILTIFIAQKKIATGKLFERFSNRSHVIIFAALISMTGFLVSFLLLLPLSLSFLSSSYLPLSLFPPSLFILVSFAFLFQIMLPLVHHFWLVMVLNVFWAIGMSWLEVGMGPCH